MSTLPAMVVGILLLLSSSSAAQRTPPIPGGLGLDTWTRGLGIDAGTQAPPGLLLIYRLIDFSANTARDRNGDALPIPGLRIGARANALAVAFTGKPHGAPYLTAVASLPLGAVSFDSDVPPVALENVGLADMFFAALRVGWRMPRYDVVTSYGFYVPTGKFDPEDAASVGRGYWINQLSLGGAVYFDSTRNPRASVLISYEHNQPRRRTGGRRGGLLNVQGGAGTTVFKNVTAGFAGYALWQVSDDRGALPPELTGARTRAYGLGPEIDVTIPKFRMRVDVRAEWDFGVVAHPQGLVFVVGVQWLAWMPAITTGASLPAGSSGRPHSRP